MKTQIITIILILSMITVVSAMNAGESLTITFDDTIRNCHIIGEDNNLEGLNFFYLDNNLIIQTIPSFKPDNLKVICEVKQTKTYSRGSSGGGTRVVYKNNTVYETEYIETNNTIEPEPTIKIETVKKVVNKIPFWVWVIFVLAIILVIILFFLLSDAQASLSDSSYQDPEPLEEDIE